MKQDPDYLMNGASIGISDGTATSGIEHTAGRGTSLDERRIVTQNRQANILSLNNVYRAQKP